MKSALLLGLVPAVAVVFAAAAGCGSTSTDNPVTPTDGGGGGNDGPATTDGGTDTSAPADTGAEGSTDPDSDAGAITGVTAQTWTWVPFADAKCRDGSETGIAVNINPASTKVMIYLEGGGACFNTITCGGNPSKFGASEFDKWKVRTFHGVMDRTDTASPVKDWSFVYVPYCTGDVHAGNNPAGAVPGTTLTQAFVGYSNIAKYMKRVVPTFSNATQVLLTGVSAGGFGAAANYDQVAKAFGAVPVDMLDDSGPLMEDPYVAQCLQDSFKTLWGLDTTVASACGADCVGNPNFMLAYLGHIAKTYPARKFGLIESTADNTISNFFGFGANNCTGFKQVDPGTFEAGLQDIRAKVTSANFGAFYFSGTAHTTLGSTEYDTRTTTAEAGTIKLSDWVTAFAGGAVTNVGP